MKRKRKRIGDFVTPEQQAEWRQSQVRLAERIAEHERKLGREPDPTPMLLATKSLGAMTAEERAQVEEWEAELTRRLEERIARGHRRAARGEA